MSTYTPAAVELGDITLCSDGENIDAIDVNGPLQDVADGVAFLASVCRPRTDVLTAASGLWTAPAGVTTVEVTMSGGTGGGGGGAGGTTTQNTTSAAGGGGGGGAREARFTLTVVPSTGYAYARGTAGTGGAGGVAGGGQGTSGTDGGDATFGALATARGSMGGHGGFLCVTTAGSRWLTRGGAQCRPTTAIAAAPFSVSDATCIFDQTPGCGGQGGTGSSAVGQFAGDGNPSPNGYVGGALGAPGALGTASLRGGGGGGGGGAGPYGPGGAGGAGGAGGGVGSPGLPGAAGTAPAAGSGAGGGGGGGGGQGGTVGGAGADGAAGATGGPIVVRYFGPQASFT